MSSGPHLHSEQKYIKEVFSQQGPLLQSFCITCGKKVLEVNLQM